MSYIITIMHIKISTFIKLIIYIITRYLCILERKYYALNNTAKNSTTKINYGETKYQLNFKII